MQRLGIHWQRGGYVDLGMGNCVTKYMIYFKTVIIMVKITCPTFRAALWKFAEILSNGTELGLE